MKLEEQLITMINDVRKEHKLPALTLNLVLNTAAIEHATNMAKQDKLSHKLDGKSVSDRLTKLGYKYSFCAENIAWNQKTNKEVLDSWMKSAGHKANILSKRATEIGLAVVPNKNEEKYWCNVFAKPMTK